MAKSDVQARPVYCHQRDSIEAHLTIVFAALAVSRWLEKPDWLVNPQGLRTARTYRTIEIPAGDHVITRPTPCLTTSTKSSTASIVIRVRTDRKITDLRWACGSGPGPGGVVGPGQWRCGVRRPG